MSNATQSKKRKSQTEQPVLNSSFVFGEDFIKQIKDNIREDLQVLYEKQVEEFNQLNRKLNYLEQQLTNIQTFMKTQTPATTPSPAPVPAPAPNPQEQSPVNRMSEYDSDSIFRSYLT